MATTSAIPENLHGAVREKSGAGFTSREISTWLKEAHEVDASYRAVARLLEKDRKSRAPIAQQIVREELESTIVSDLDRSNKVWDELEALQTQAATLEFTGVPNDGIPALRLRQMEAQRSIIDTKRKLLSDRMRMAGVTDSGGVGGGLVVMPAEEIDVEPHEG
jgi:hypothetical protein